MSKEKIWPVGTHKMAWQPGHEKNQTPATPCRLLTNPANQPPQDSCSSVFSSSLNLSVMKLLLLALALLPFVSAAAIGADVCACAPSQYTFTLNLSKTCDDVNFDQGPGVSQLECAPSAENSSSDMIPVSIASIEFEEVTSGEDSAFQRRTGFFGDGSIVSFDSYVQTAELSRQDDVPGIVKITLNGRNEAGQAVTQSVSIRFDERSCGISAIMDGDSIGWIEFVRFGTVAHIFWVSVSRSLSLFLIV